MESVALVLLGFLAGVALGVAVYRFLPASRSHRQLQRERDDAIQALERYRREVDEHFVESAEALSELDQAFRTVHARLASGARQLCSEEGRRMALARAVEALPEEDKLPESLHAPLDYAPSAKGTLDENFGLRETDELADFDVPELPPERPRDYAEGVEDCEDAACTPRENQRSH